MALKITLNSSITYRQRFFVSVILVMIAAFLFYTVLQEISLDYSSGRVFIAMHSIGRNKVVKQYCGNIYKIERSYAYSGYGPYSCTFTFKVYGSRNEALIYIRLQRSIGRETWEPRQIRMVIP